MHGFDLSRQAETAWMYYRYRHHSTRLLGDAPRGGLVHRPEEVLQRRLLAPHHLLEGQLALALQVHLIKD